MTENVFSQLEDIVKLTLHSPAQYFQPTNHRSLDQDYFCTAIFIETCNLGLQVSGPEMDFSFWVFEAKRTLDQSPKIYVTTYISLGDGHFFPLHIEY